MVEPGARPLLWVFASGLARIVLLDRPSRNSGVTHDQTPLVRRVQGAFVLAMLCIFSACHGEHAKTETLRTFAVPATIFITSGNMRKVQTINDRSTLRRIAAILNASLSEWSPDYPAGFWPAPPAASLLQFRLFATRETNIMRASRRPHSVIELYGDDLVSVYTEPWSPEHYKFSRTLSRRLLEFVRFPDGTDGNQLMPH